MHQPQVARNRHRARRAPRARSRREQRGPGRRGAGGGASTAGARRGLRLGGRRGAAAAALGWLDRHEGDGEARGLRHLRLRLLVADVAVTVEGLRGGARRPGAETRGAVREGRGAVAGCRLCAGGRAEGATHLDGEGARPARDAALEPGAVELAEARVHPGGGGADGEGRPLQLAAVLALDAHLVRARLLEVERAAERAVTVVHHVAHHLQRLRLRAAARLDEGGDAVEGVSRRGEGRVVGVVARLVLGLDGEAQRVAHHNPATPSGAWAWEGAVGRPRRPAWRGKPSPAGSTHFPTASFPDKPGALR